MASKCHNCIYLYIQKKVLLIIIFFFLVLLIKAGHSIDCKYILISEV